MDWDFKPETRTETFTTIEELRKIDERSRQGVVDGWFIRRWDYSPAPHISSEAIDGVVIYEKVLHLNIGDKLLEEDDAEKPVADRPCDTEPQPEVKEADEVNWVKKINAYWPSRERLPL